MKMNIIMNGKQVAERIKIFIAEQIKETNITPKLAIFTIGDDDASKVYVKNKMKAAAEIGIHADQIIINYEQYIDPLFEEKLDTIIEEYDGVILQLPVPKWCDAETILKHIPAEKDVDGLTTYQMGLLRAAPSEALLPCTPAGIMDLLRAYVPQKARSGNAVVIGRSNLVSKPIAELLLQADYTVTICHSKTPKHKLIEAFLNADLVVSAAGKQNLITEEDALQFWKDNRHYYFPDSFEFKNKRVIVDVSINRDENGKLCGDFSEEFKQKYSEYYTPVPGGVGPMTVAMLMFNTYLAAKHGEFWENKEKKKELTE